MKIVDESLSWKEQRQLWNEQGHCAREACDYPHDGCTHQVTALRYCVSCARGINGAVGELIDIDPAAIRSVRQARRDVAQSLKRQ